MVSGEDVFALAVELVLDGQDEQAGDEHGGAHDEVASGEGARVDFDPGHHVRADPAAEVAAGVDQGNGTSCCRTRQESRRDRPPDAHGGMDADSGEADEREGDGQALCERGEAEADGRLYHRSSWPSC